MDLTPPMSESTLNRLYRTDPPQHQAAYNQYYSSILYNICFLPNPTNPLLIILVSPYARVNCSREYCVKGAHIIYEFS